MTADGSLAEVSWPERSRAPVGRVASISGSKLIMLLEDPPVSEAQGVTTPVQKGTLVKMQCGEVWVFGLVGGVSIPVPSRSGAESELVLAEVELLGELERELDGATRGFRRGVSYFPGVGEYVFPTTQEDLSEVYAGRANGCVRIGTIHQDRSIPALVMPDELLGKHFAILGTTGSGKSCAAAVVLRRILDAHPNAHVVLLDLHNEYTEAFRDKAEIIAPDTLELPYWLFNFEELTAIVLGPEADLERAAEASILGELIPQAKENFLKDRDEIRHITVDTPTPYAINDLINLIDAAMGKLDRPDKSVPYLRLKSKINALKTDSRYSFMFGGIAVRDNMTRILRRIFRVPVDGKPISIFDLSAVPSEILNVVVSVLCRLTFDFALFNDRSVPISLVCEEAHRYLPQSSALGFEPTKRALSRIAKEGRKYGLSLCLVSQRPSDLAISALSQCNTVFALRLTSQTDQDFVGGAMPDWCGGLLDFLPSLRNGEAIIVGEGIPVPARVQFDFLPEHQRPRSGTASFSRAWKDDFEDIDFVDEVVRKWRNER